MKLPRTLMLIWMITPLSFAGEMLESLKTREGREYFKVEVLTNDDVGIRIRHDAGTARIPYEDLPDDVQSKYHAERKKATILKIKTAKAEAERIQREEEKTKQMLLEENAKKPVKKRPIPETPEAAVSKASLVERDREIEKLDAYIVEMKVRAKEAVSEASRLRGQAEVERSRTRSVIKNYSDRGTVVKVLPDKSGWAKATRYEEQAAVLERQADDARAMIVEAKAKRVELLENSVAPESGD